MAVPILKQGTYLIASIQGALSDTEVIELRDDITERIGRLRSRGVIVDVAAMDVIDSFVARSLRTIALTAKLRGAETVIVGIQPDVAVAMVHFELNLEPLHTALDLEEGLELLDTPDREALRQWPMRSGLPVASDADIVPARAGPRARDTARLLEDRRDADRDGDLRDRAEHRRARRRGEISIEPIDEDVALRHRRRRDATRARASATSTRP